MHTILTVAEEYWPESGGGNLATHLIVKLLSQRDDAKVVVVTGAEDPATVAGVKYISTPLLRAPNKIRLWSNLTLLVRCKWFQEMLDPTDVVYIPRFCYPVVPLARRRGKEVIVHLHNYQPISYNATVLHDSHKSDGLDAIKDATRYELMEHNSPTRAMISGLLAPATRLGRIWISEADSIICVSRRQHEIVSSAAPELAGRLEVIYNLLPEVPIAEKQLGKPTMMYLGGDSYLKGFQVFLRASCELLKQIFDIKFMLTRAFKDANRLLIERLNKKFGGAYSLLGCPKYEELLGLHSRSWALLFPSIWEEPLAYSVVEAMLAGTVPIASKVGGITEIVKGTFAQRMLFEPNSVECFVDRMESLVAMSKEQVMDIGLSLREAVLKRFDPGPTRKKLLEVFLS